MSWNFHSGYQFQQLEEVIAFFCFYEKNDLFCQVLQKKKLIIYVYSYLIWTKYT